MTDTIVMRSGTEGGAAQVDSSETEQTAQSGRGRFPSSGTTAEKPYMLRIGSIAIRASSEAEVNDLKAYLSNYTGVPTDELSEIEFLACIPIDQLGNHFFFEPGNAQGLVTSYELNQTFWDQVSQFNSNSLFGDAIPSFPPGTGSFFGLEISPNDTGTDFDASLGGLRGIAEQIYDGNYSAEGTTKLNPIDMDSLDPGVREMLVHLFGGNTTFDEGHLNVLKMMGLASGSANASAAEWRLTADQGEQVRLAFNKPHNSFVPSSSLLNLQDADFTKANGVAQYFNTEGNFHNDFTPKDVEKVNKDLCEKMVSSTPLTPTVTVTDNVKKTLNFLFGLDAENTAFTTEQVNSAIATGLVRLEPNGHLALTTNGQGYLAAKSTPVTDTTNETPPVTPPQPTTTDQTDRFLRELMTTEIDGISVFDYFDIGQNGGAAQTYTMGGGVSPSPWLRKDGLIHHLDIEALANKDVNDNSQWQGAFSNLSVEERTRLVTLAKFAIEHEVLAHMSNNSGTGQLYEGAFNQEHNSIHRNASDNYVKFIIGDRDIPGGRIP